jgi:lipopolysaccharide export LptBFGC system permease protein LptF
MKTLIKIIFILFISLQMVEPATAQTKKQTRDAAKAAEVKKQIDAKSFTFQARYMYPMGGGQRYLNTDYDVRVTKDSVIAFLPYFGVAYAGAGYNSNEDNGIKFTSTKFDYQTELKKNGSWYVVIKPQDSRTTNQLIFNISPNGSADLSVISTNRQRIRFDGYLKDKPKN